MARVESADTGNTLLDALSDDDRALLAPHLEKVHIGRGEMLIVPDAPIEHVHFMLNGIASITQATPENERTEIGIFGRDGMSATPVLLGEDRTPHETFIQVGDVDALRISAGRFVELVEGSVTLRAVMLRYVQTMMVQVAQCAVANARHGIESRLARWLLMCHDRVDGDTIALTHEFMAIMIAAQRSGVTLALHVLEGTGTIRSGRGRVTIRDRKRLEELAGDGYGLAEAEYRRLIGPLGRSA